MILVCDQQQIVLIAELAQHLDVLRWRHNYAARALHRFCDDGGNRVCPFLTHDLLNRVDCQLRGLLRVAVAEPVDVRRQGVEETGRGRSEAVPVLRDTGRTQSRQRDAVVSVHTGDDLVFLGLSLDVPEITGHLEGGLVRLAATAREEDPVEIAGRKRGQLGGQLNRRDVREPGVAVAESQLSHLRGGGLCQLSSAMAHVDVPETGQAVEIAPAVDVSQPDSLAALENDRVLVRLAMVERVNEVVEVVLHELLDRAGCCHVRPPCR